MPAGPPPTTAHPVLSMSHTVRLPVHASTERQLTLKPPVLGANWQLMTPNGAFEVISCQFARP